MITPELLAAAPTTSGWRTFDSPPPVRRVGEWAATDVWVARTPPFAAEVEEADKGVAELIGGWQCDAETGPRLIEDESLRLPFVLGRDDERKTCKSCRGTGDHDCNCDDCESGCVDCDGEGKRITVKGIADDLGQRVYEGAGVVTAVQARLGALLDGYRVVRLGAKNIDPLGGIDETGRLVVVVSAMRADVRR